MTHSNTQVYVHVTFTTKYRVDCFRDRRLINILFEHILENAIKKNITIDCIGGAVDHLHLLIRLKKSSDLANTIKLIKGESSWWLKRNLFGFEKFEWQTGYDARSVHFQELNPVRNYIRNQEAHHANK